VADAGPDVPGIALSMAIASSRTVSGAWLARKWASAPLHKARWPEKAPKHAVMRALGRTMVVMVLPGEGMGPLTTCSLLLRS
jgi:hypothetical protein